MRRKDREVTDIKRIAEIIDKCDIIRLGFSDGEFPYIVPLNFGYKIEGDQVEFYIHGAKAGRKYELIQKKGQCSFEMDNPLQFELLYDAHDVTMRYESVMGTAKIELLEGEEKQHAIDDIIMARYDNLKDFEYNKSVVPSTAIAKLTVIDIVGKVNPVSGGADL